MSRFVLVVGASVLAVAVQAVLGAAAFAQDQPSVEPAPDEDAPPEAPPGAAVSGEALPGEPPPVPRPPVAQETALRPAVFDNAGVDFGARLGFALPFGYTSGGAKLGETVATTVPLVLEIGYRVNGTLTIGALFQYAFSQIEDSAVMGCGGNVSCSGSVVRLGVEGIYNFNTEVLSPWVGLGTGYEWFDISRSMSGQNVTNGVHGFEYLTVQAGGDYRVSRRFALGPFVSLSVGEYATSSYEIQGMSGTADLTDKKLHEWLQLGVRGRFGL